MKNQMAKTKLLAMCLAFLMSLTIVALVDTCANDELCPDETNLLFTRMPKQLDLWPYPQQVEIIDKFFVIKPREFTIHIDSPGSCPVLDRAVKRVRDYLFLADCSRLDADARPPVINKRDVSKAEGTIGNLTLVVKEQCESIPTMSMSEMYRLEIADGSATSFSQTIWGAIRALETFSQLVAPVDNNNTWTINSTRITDYPRFEHRGLMIDTSRHFVPVKLLKVNLDAMAYNKMNVFHWHIVDDQSFPYVSRRFPQLHQKGAFDPTTHVYTPEEVKEIIDYAHDRGIRVMVEFDSPGHTQSWGKSQPGLLTPCYSANTTNGKFGPIDPTKQDNYKFIRNLLNEAVEAFPDKLLHVGGDEVNPACWESNPDVLKFMKAKNFSNYKQLESYYIENVLSIVGELNRSGVVWQESFDRGAKLAQDTVVHVWFDKSNWFPNISWEDEVSRVTKANHKVLLSGCWYLDMIQYRPDWQKFYECDPHKFIGTDAQKKLVIGGEACMWNEFVDGSNVISRTWPRTLSVAEKLWSPASLSSPSEAAYRFGLHRCRMQQRGVRGQPIGPGFCKCDHAV